MLQEYETWDTGTIILSPVTRLYHSSPIGLGTPMVESLTGYIVRLAEAHCVSAGILYAKEIKALATMPSKEELYSKLLFLINAPAQRLVTVMNAVGRDLAVVVSQGVEKKKFKDEGGAAAAAAPAPAEAAPAEAGSPA